MAYQGIVTGTSPNDGTGDTLIDGAVKINSNFQEIYNALGDAGTISFDEKVQDAIGSAIDGGTQTGLSVTYNDLFNRIDFELSNFIQNDSNAVSRSIESKLRDTVSVKDFGAVGDGVTNDTNAFNNAINFAGDGGSVYAPPGTYKVNGILLKYINQTIVIEGTLLLSSGNVGIIFDRSSEGSSTQNCNVYVNEIKNTSTTQRPTDNTIGVSFRNGSFNAVKFNRIGFLHYGFKLEPGSISPEGLTSDNRIIGNLIEWCKIGVYSAGGSSQALNHTEHTMVEVNFIAHYQYGIYKTNSTGSQKFWYVNTALDAFPGTNPDYEADIFDDYVQSNDENLSACWYQTYFSTDDNAYQGNAFSIGRNCYLFDVTRRRAEYGNTVKFDTYLGKLELKGPITSPGTCGIGMSSNDGTGYFLKIDDGGTINLPSRYSRTIPQIYSTISRTLQAEDTGKHITIISGDITINSGVFETGNTVTVYNNSASSMSIISGAGVTLRRASVGDTGNRTLSSYGFATIKCVGTNQFVIFGFGLS
jgi:hypothetical protein